MARKTNAQAAAPAPKVTPEREREIKLEVAQSMLDLRERQLADAITENLERAERILRDMRIAATRDDKAQALREMDDTLLGALYNFNITSHAALAATRAEAALHVRYAREAVERDQIAAQKAAISTSLEMARQAAVAEARG